MIKGRYRFAFATPLLWPSLAFLGVFFVYPLAGMLWRSIQGHPVSLGHYAHFLHEPVYLQVLRNTFEIAGVVTIICVALGYPLAYLLATVAPRASAVLIVLVIIPYFTSTLVRTYAWMILLGREGIVNTLLLHAHLIQRPLALMYNRFGVLVGISYILLPYMVLAMYSVMRGIDRNLLRAAESLGAGNRQGFLRIFLPLSMPGVAGGSLLVFILTLGYFITPALMGGTKDTMIAMVIENQVDVVLNWGFASTLSVALLLVTLIGFFVYDRLLGLEQLLTAKV